MVWEDGWFLRALLVLLASGQLVLLNAGRLEEERLIGWQGDTYKPHDPSNGTEGQDPNRFWIEQISWRPRAVFMHNFITKQEATHIANLAWPQMQRSTVVGANGSSVLDSYRTSYGTFVMRYQDDVVKAVQDRISLVTHVPVVNQEDMQVLRYAPNQYYHKHEDSLLNDSPRIATLLIYLATATEGGETSFPDGSEWINPEQATRYGSQFSSCAKVQQETWQDSQEGGRLWVHHNPPSALWGLLKTGAAADFPTGSSVYTIKSPLPDATKVSLRKNDTRYKRHLVFHYPDGVWPVPGGLYACMHAGMASSQDIELQGTAKAMVHPWSKLAPSEDYRKNPAKVYPTDLPDGVKPFLKALHQCYLVNGFKLDWAVLKTPRLITAQPNLSLLGPILAGQPPLDLPSSVRQAYAELLGSLFQLFPEEPGSKLPAQRRAATLFRTLAAYQAYSYWTNTMKNQASVKQSKKRQAEGAGPSQ